MAEKAFGFFRSKSTFLKNKHCACIVRARRGFFFPQKSDFLKKCRHDDDDDTETPDPVQAQIPSHPGIKYPVRGIPPSDVSLRLLALTDTEVVRTIQEETPHWSEGVPGLLNHTLNCFSPFLWSGSMSNGSGSKFSARSTY